MNKTVIINIRDFAFPPITIREGTFVVWRNLDPVPHSAETLGQIGFYFNAGALHPGELSSPVYFPRAGTFPYLCRFHAGMEGSITVLAHSEKEAAHAHGEGHEHEADHGHGLRHFHGFVTGGRSGNRFFMSHTPVLADPRHHFQIILQGSLIQEGHVRAYDELRGSAYGDGRVQIFHDHLALPDIRDGKVTELPHSEFEYYPERPEEGKPVPGLEADIPVRIDRVLHFHQFEPDTNYPEGLSYIVYGDADDVFIDHHITRAPNFHSVAKLAARPDFWAGGKSPATVEIRVPSKRIFDVSPKLLSRVAFVDNAFHIIWLPPSGVQGRPVPDPLIPRDGSAPEYDVVLPDGKRSRIAIGRFLHFDVRLLNHGVLIV